MALSELLNFSGFNEVPETASLQVGKVLGTVLPGGRVKKLQLTEVPNLWHKVLAAYQVDQKLSDFASDLTLQGSASANDRIYYRRGDELFGDAHEAAHIYVGFLNPLIEERFGKVPEFPVRSEASFVAYVIHEGVADLIALVTCFNQGGESASEAREWLNYRLGGSRHSGEVSVDPNFLLQQFEKLKEIYKNFQETAIKADHWRNDQYTGVFEKLFSRGKISPPHYSVGLAFSLDQYQQAITAGVSRSTALRKVIDNPPATFDDLERSLSLKVDPSIFEV